ncbi:hypothetical protein JXM67_02860 [candidate division WOR-3 bacterium]|nr:hypothetical protein [candidate division WOR-3 bacterium]
MIQCSLQTKVRGKIRGLRVCVAIALTSSLFTLQAYAQVWEPYKQVTDDTHLNYLANNNAYATAVDGFNIHVVWWNDDQDSIWYSRSEDNGETWTQEIPIGEGTHPAIVSEGSTLRVVWTAEGPTHDMDIFYSHSTNNGGSWVSPTNISETSSDSYNPSIACLGNSVHVVWNEAGTDILHNRSTNNGLTWGDSKNIATGLVGNPAISILGTASLLVHVFIVWEDSLSGTAQINHRHSSNNGTDWGTVNKVNSGSADAYSPSIASTTQGVQVAWIDNRDGNPSIFHNFSLNQGATWNPVDTRIVDLGVIDSAYQPSVSAHESDVHVTWIDTRNPFTAIYYDHSEDNGFTWMEDKPVTDSLRNPHNPSIASYDSDIHTVWYDDSATYQNIFYAHAGEVQPDNLIRNRFDVGYIGDDVYNRDGTGQTSQQLVDGGDTAVYYIMIQNDGDIPDEIIVTGDSSVSGWKVAYYNSLTGGTDITDEVTESGWLTGELSEDDNISIRAEIIPDDTVPSGSFFSILIISASSNDTTYVDAVRANAVVSNYQPDNHIKNSYESVYIGDNIYNVTGANQTEEQSIGIGDTAIYHVMIQNDGPDEDSFKVTATPTGTGWDVKYYDGIQSEYDITAQVTTTGWFSPLLGVSSITRFRVEVTPITADSGDSHEIMITSTSTKDTFKHDVVKAITVIGSGVTEELSTGEFTLNTETFSEYSRYPVIFYELPEATWTDIVIYDVTGTVVRNLVNTRKDAGSYRITWDGRNNQGLELPSGLYFCMLKTPKRILDGKLLLFK